MTGEQGAGHGPGSGGGAAGMTAGGVTADGRARILADGHRMPMLGLGV